jgi:glycosyltransferase involved in cell wall biosynthesis
MLTVSLPTCDGARHLAEALRSIRAQEGEGVAFDLVVCDDRSGDETLWVVADMAGDRARVVVNSERLGLAANWNRCAAECRTPLVAIFHQDDVMRPGHLAAHLAAFEARPDLGMACGAAEVIDDDGRPVPPSVVEPGGVGPVDRTFEPGEFVRELAVGNPLRCSAVTLRVASHAAVGGFEPAYRYVVDWDCWLRLARAFPVAWLARPTVAVRWHPSSETHRFKKGTLDLDETARLLDALYRDDGPRLDDARGLRRRADRRLARAFLNRAYDALRGGDPILARRCLGRSLRLDPGLLGTIAADPRLAARLVLLAVAPGLATRRRQGPEGSNLPCPRS